MNMKTIISFPEISRELGMELHEGLPFKIKKKDFSFYSKGSTAELADWFLASPVS